MGTPVVTYLSVIPPSSNTINSHFYAVAQNFLLIFLHPCMYDNDHRVCLSLHLDFPEDFVRAARLSKCFCICTLREHLCVPGTVNQYHLCELKKKISIHVFLFIHRFSHPHKLIQFFLAGKKKSITESA